MKKIFFILLGLLLIIGVVVFICILNIDNPDDDEECLYKDIIDEYTLLVDKKIKGKKLTEPSNSADEIKVALFEIVRDTEDASIMGYATKDINGDGIEELVLLNKSNKLYALFTLSGDSPELLLKMDKMSAAIIPDGTVYANKYNKDQGEFTYIKKISGGRLEGLEYGVVINGDSATYYKIENGLKTDIIREEANQFYQSINPIMMMPWYQNKTVGFRFVPAVSEASPSTAPVPDFSSYDGIISAYKIIVESFSEYNESDWMNGKFDDLFTIKDNATYDVFHEIFWGGIRKMPTESRFSQQYATDGDNSYGYAKKDLNGDGVEELILLQDNYEIFALFTEKNGKAQLVKDAFGALIDENGRIRKDIGTGGLVSRDAEAYVYVLDGTTLKPEIAVGYKVNIYLQKEGWYKIENGKRIDISAEEGEALYKAFDIVPSGYSQAEYIRTFSGIEFTPLFEATLAGNKYINTFSNYWFVNGGTLTVSRLAENSVIATVKFVYTEGQFDPETNTEPVEYITELNVQATRNGSRYEFEKDGVKGFIEFAVNSVWVVVTESQNEHVIPRAHFFDYPEN